MLTDIALSIIVLAMFVLVPVGCMATRPPKRTDSA
jgi:hypothetical protein